MKTTHLDSWIDSYEDAQPDRSPAPSGQGIEPIAVSTADAKRLLGGIDDKTLREWRSQGHLDGAWFKVGGRVLYYVEALREAVQRLCDASALTARAEPSH